MNGSRWATACFITRADLTTWGRNILPWPKRSPTTFMPSISGPSITRSGCAEFEPRLLGVLDDELVDAVDERVHDPFVDGQLAPGVVCLAADTLVVAVSLRDLEQALGRIRTPVENHILDSLAELRLDLLVQSELAGVDDRHIEPCCDRVVEEHRMDRLADRLVAAERERHVRDASGDPGSRQPLLDLPDGLDEGERVLVVLGDAGCDSEDVRVEDDVLGVESGALCQQVVGALADRDLALDGIGLALLIERHHDNGGAVATDLAGNVEELAPRPP